MSEQETEKIESARRNGPFQVLVRGIRMMFAGVGLVTIILIAWPLGVFVLSVMYVIGSLMIYWPLMHTSVELEYARQYRPVFQAICDYREEHGILPEQIEDCLPENYQQQIVPKWSDFDYEKERNSGMSFQLIISGMLHQVQCQLTYQFHPTDYKQDGGWSTEGIPPLVPTSISESKND